jgi:phospholipid/cholesterol/gamma-HCH transport system substrate-binding protein
MGLFEEHDPRFVHLERKVGIFVTLGIAATIAVVLLLGAKQGLFTPRASIFFRVESADDLSEGSEVLTRGFRIGTVSRLRLDDEGKVEVRLAVDRSSLRWVKRDSEARLAKGLLVGGAKVVITPGSPGADPLADGATIRFVEDAGLSAAAQRVVEELKPVVKQLADTIARLADPQGDFQTTLANLNRLTANLDATQRGVGTVLDSAGAHFNKLADDLDATALSLRQDVLPEVRSVIAKADQTAAGAERTARAAENLVGTDVRRLVETLRLEVIPQVQAVIRSADGAVQDAGGATAALRKDLPPILEKLDASLANIQAVTADLKQASAQTPELFRNGGALVEDAQGLVKKVNGMWLLRDDGQPPQERTIDADSYQRRK